MRIGFRSAEFGALESLWNKSYPECWRLDADSIRRHSSECKLLDWGASSIAMEDGQALGMLSVKKSPCPSLFSGPDPDTAHLSAIAFEDPGVAIDLFAEAKRTLRNRGIHRVVFGQDVNHVFSGCPEDCGSLRSFLLVEGFEEDGRNVDLERDLSDYEPPAGCLDVLGDYPGCKQKKPGLPTVHPLKLSQAGALRTFLEREFPGRWTYDTMNKLEVEGKSDFVYVLEADGDIAGFALTQDASHQFPQNGAVWRQSLGENWGALGPIGVSSAVRGRGLGNALLGASLLGLQGRGAKRSIIDWTGLEGFYGAHGFEVTRRYLALSLML